MAFGSGAGTAWAEVLKLTGSSKSRAALFSSQTRLLDSRLATQYYGSARLQPEPKVAETSRSASGRYSGKYLETARAAARKHAVPEDLFLRLVQQEIRGTTVRCRPRGRPGWHS